jgi:hypothetical protein
MDNIEISNFIFLKTKNTKNFKKTNDGTTLKKNYGIVDKNNKKISFELKNVKIPFGVEDYNKDKILNIIIDPKENNDNYNICIFLKNIEDEFNNYKINDNDILIDTKNKKYHYILKKNPTNDTYLLRTHILGIPNIYTSINGINIPIIENDVKNRKVNIKIEIGTLWVTENSFGLLLYSKEIKII